MVTIKEIRKKAKKKYWSRVQKYLHYTSFYIVKPLVNTKIAPNQITIFWVLLQVLSTFLLLGNYLSQIIGIVIFNFVINIFDCVDGNLARVRGQSSPSGVYLEVLGLYTGTPLLFLMLGLKSFFMLENVLFLYIGFIGAIFFLYSRLFNLNPIMFSNLSYDLVKKSHQKGSFRKKQGFLGKISNLFRRGQPFNLFFFGVIFQFIPLTVLIYFVLFFLEMLRRLYVNYRFLRRLEN